MKTKAILLLIALLVTVGHGLRAQVPGYMGKKGMVGAGGYWFPQIRPIHFCSPIWNGKDGCEKGTIRPNTAAFVGYERTVSRTLAVGASLESYGTGRILPVVDSVRWVVEDVPTLIFNSGVGIHVKTFPFTWVGGIAPYGNYFYSRLAFNRAVERRADVEKGSGTESLIARYSGYQLAIGGGRNILLSESIVLDLGFRVSANTVLPSKEDRRRKHLAKALLLPDLLKFTVRLYWLH